MEDEQAVLDFKLNFDVMARKDTIAFLHIKDPVDTIFNMEQKLGVVA